MGDLVVGCLVVVNAGGDIVDRTGNIIAGARSKEGRFFGEADEHRTFSRGKVLDQSNTTLAIVATNGEFNKTELFRISQQIWTSSQK